MATIDPNGISVDSSGWDPMSVSCGKMSASCPALALICMTVQIAAYSQNFCGSRACASAANALSITLNIARSTRSTCASGTRRSQVMPTAAHAFSKSTLNSPPSSEIMAFGLSPIASKVAANAAIHFDASLFFAGPHTHEYCYLLFAACSRYLAPFGAGGYGPEMSITHTSFLPACWIAVPARLTP